MEHVGAEQPDVSEDGTERWGIQHCGVEQVVFGDFHVDGGVFTVADVAEFVSLDVRRQFRLIDVEASEPKEGVSIAPVGAGPFAPGMPIKADLPRGPGDAWSDGIKGHCRDDRGVWSGLPDCHGDRVGRVDAYDRADPDTFVKSLVEFNPARVNRVGDRHRFRPTLSIPVNDIQAQIDIAEDRRLAIGRGDGHRGIGKAPEVAKAARPAGFRIRVAECQDEPVTFPRIPVVLAPIRCAELRHGGHDMAADHRRILLGMLGDGDHLDRDRHGGERAQDHAPETTCDEDVNDRCGGECQPRDGHEQVAGAPRTAVPDEFHAVEQYGDDWKHHRQCGT